MIDKYGVTPLLLVAQSSTLIQQQKYEEAEKLLLVSPVYETLPVFLLEATTAQYVQLLNLQEALQRDANYAEAVVNLVVVSQHLGKAPEVSSSFQNIFADDLL